MKTRPWIHSCCLFTVNFLLPVPSEFITFLLLWPNTCERQFKGERFIFAHISKSIMVGKAWRVYVWVITWLDLLPFWGGESGMLALVFSRRSSQLDNEDELSQLVRANLHFLCKTILPHVRILYQEVRFRKLSSVTKSDIQYQGVGWGLEALY